MWLAVCRAGTASGVGSDDADALYIAFPPGGLFLLLHAPVGLLFLTPFSQQPPDFILCLPWSKAIDCWVLFGAWLSSWRARHPLDFPGRDPYPSVWCQVWWHRDMWLQRLQFLILSCFPQPKGLSLARDENSKVTQAFSACLDFHQAEVDLFLLVSSCPLLFQTWPDEVNCENAKTQAENKRLCIGNLQHLSYDLPYWSFVPLLSWPPLLWHVCYGPGMHAHIKQE